jgi:hypothetical protein
MLRFIFETDYIVTGKADFRLEQAAKDLISEQGENRRKNNQIFNGNICFCLSVYLLFIQL